MLDINTNPKNPIISTRAFGEDAETVSFFGIEMIKALQANGIAACGKHFPGHGDTEIDSHIGLPLIKKDIQSLEKTELAPFRSAVKAGVKMIMLGHLKVPALGPIRDSRIFIREGCQISERQDGFQRHINYGCYEYGSPNPRCHCEESRKNRDDVAI